MTKHNHGDREAAQFLDSQEGIGAQENRPSHEAAQGLGAAPCQVASQVFNDKADNNLASLFSVAYQELVTHPEQTARQVLERFSDLGAHSKYAIELIYEEYCRDRADKPDLSTADFLERYADYSSQLRRILSVHQEIANPEVLDRIDDIAWPAVGETHGDLELVERLGRGAFATVYRARQKSVDDRNVVVKFTANSQGEVAALSRLTHSNIVPIYTVNRFDKLGLNAICMPYLGRNTLFDLLQVAYQESKPPANVGELRVFLPADPTESDLQRQRIEEAWDRPYGTWLVEKGIQLLDALEFSHSRSVLHCDLKPSNVLIDAHADAHLIDFNLAQNQGEGRRGGTLPYMAPEQLRELASVDGDREITTKTDLFGWGVMMGQLLTGDLPFQNGDVAGPAATGHADEAQRLLQAQEQGMPDEWAKSVEVPDEVIALIRSAMEFLPANRPSSATELATRLRECLSSRQESIEQTSKSSSIKITKRRVVAGAVAAGFVLVLGTAGTITAIQSGWFPGASNDESLSKSDDAEPNDQPPLGSSRLPHEEAFQLFNEGDLHGAIHAYFVDGKIDPDLLTSVELTEVSYMQATELLDAKKRPVASATIQTWLNSGQQRNIPEGDLLILAIHHAIVSLVDIERESKEVSDATYKALAYFLDESAVNDRSRPAFHHVMAMLHVSKYIHLPSARSRLGKNEPSDIELAMLHIEKAIGSNPTSPDVYLDRALITLTDSIGHALNDPEALDAIFNAVETDFDSASGVVDSADMERLQQLLQQARTATNTYTTRQSIHALIDLIWTTRRESTNRTVEPPRFEKLRLLSNLANR